MGFQYQDDDRFDALLAQRVVKLLWGSTWPQHQGSVCARLRQGEHQRAGLRCHCFSRTTLNKMTGGRAKFSSEHSSRAWGNLELAVVVGTRVTVPRRLVDIALRDKDAHGLGIVDSLGHLGE